ncbi:MAG TPA: 4Fe-4S binding protein [Anaerolineae bacterium]|nr:4Fe-4S binding protein [Anaerolineae bacterium]
MILSKFRRSTQFLSAIIVNSFFGSFVIKTINANALKGICVPFLNCYACPTALFSCPIGTLQHFMAIHAIPYYLLGFIGLIGLSVGRMACGWLCPFGLLQDLIYKIKTPKHGIPSRLSYLKYLVLIMLVIVIPYITGDLWFSKLCPAGTLMGGLAWTVWDPVNAATGLPVLPDGPGVIFYVALVILIGFLIWFVLSKRPFCRVVCPMGAIFSLFNRYSIIHLDVSQNCDGCNVCEVKCPMDLNVSIDFDSGDCIRCLECTKCGHVKLVTPFSKYGGSSNGQRGNTDAE